MKSKVNEPARRSSSRTSVVSKLCLGGCLLQALMACEPKPPERAHPGCPGESFRSATSATDCVCKSDQVLRAGALQCEQCDPTTSLGLFCDCGNGNVFSFDGQLEVTLGLVSDQVTCEEPSQCDAGTRYDAAQGDCVACAQSECGSSCGKCSVGLSCVSGVCTLAAACEIEKVEFSGQHGFDDSCAWGEGEIATAASYDLLAPGIDCSFSDEKCTYSAQAYPLGGWEPSCPSGTKRSASDPDLCVCKDEGEVIRSGSLECDSCDPVASQGFYCDCGVNAVFSNHVLMEAAYLLASDRPKCVAPSACPEGQRLDELTSECVTCGETDCGQGCPLCFVGGTCISGTCVDAAMGKVTAVLGSSISGGACILAKGDLVPLGLITEYVPGQTYEYVEYDGCVYQVEAEALSR